MICERAEKGADITNENLRRGTMIREKKVYCLLLSILQEEGQSLAEYALVLFLIMLVAVAALTLLGQNVSALFNAFANAF